MPQWIKNLITGRSAVVAAVAAVILLARKTGLGVPAELETSVGNVIDSLLVVLGTAIGGGLLHNAAPPGSEAAPASKTHITVPPKEQP